MEDWIIDGVRYTTEPTELCYDDLKALADKRLEELRQIKILIDNWSSSDADLVATIYTLVSRGIE